MSPAPSFFCFLLQDFVKLQVQRFRVAVLAVLNEKQHQEGGYDRACVDDQLPGVWRASKVS